MVPNPFSLLCQSIHLLFVYAFLAFKVIAISTKDVYINYRWPLTVLFLVPIYFSISFQFYLNIKSYNIFVNVPAMQLKIALDWEPVDNVWNSLGVDGAMIPVIQEEDTALKGLLGGQWSLLECIIMRWLLTPVFVLKRRTMSGPLSSVQVIGMWWKHFSFCLRTPRIIFPFLL